MAVGKYVPLEITSGDQRIVVVGTTGSGKSTLARKLAAEHRLTDVDLDALYWGPNWTPVSADEFSLKVSTQLPIDGKWIAHGGFSAVRDIVWGRATTLIWLDYPFGLNLWRLLIRTAKRVATGEKLWSGNIETFNAQFSFKSGIIFWFFKTYWKNKRTLSAAIQSAPFSHLKVIHLKNPPS
jgi:adenylate kinase family enzyme